MNIIALRKSLLLALFFSVNVATASTSTYVFKAPLCSQIFSSDAETWLDRQVVMNPSYIGENLGIYVDPVTRKAWNVKYFTPQERLAYMIVPKNGYLFDTNGKKANSEFDSDSLHFETSLIVINKDQEILVLPMEERGRFHHSTLSAGENVIFAGTATFSNGKLRSLSDQSGHYKPDPLQFMVALRTLFLIGVDLSQTRLEGNFPQKVFATPSMTPAEVKDNLGALFEDRPLSLKEIEQLLWRP